MATDDHREYIKKIVDAAPPLTQSSAPVFANCCAP
ncbi:hypothetical protein MMON44395_07605 [Mycolicibacterium monacense DSM 44395]|nr:hypothetical protein [Mycolicibacterium monacense DSM 44395]